MWICVPRLAGLVDFRLLIIHCTQNLTIKYISENVGASVTMRRSGAIRWIRDFESDDRPFWSVGELVLVGDLTLYWRATVTGVNGLTRVGQVARKITLFSK